MESLGKILEQTLAKTELKDISTLQFTSQTESASQSDHSSHSSPNAVSIIGVSCPNCGLLDPSTLSVRN